jgi:glycosyltransferase involved in cell wall biosynthesis
MHIVLATGIYPPDIGGPATYVRALAKELTLLGHDITVITYGKEETRKRTEWKDENWRVISVPWKGKPIIRWFLFALALRKFAKLADIIEAFSSVSVGVPMLIAHLRQPKKILRLGGDFLWERATDRGDGRSLTEWYGSRKNSPLMMRLLLKIYDHIIFSSQFQKDLYTRHYRELPSSSVIENALTPNSTPAEKRRHPHSPFRLLFLGRFVAFKNLSSLIRALVDLPDCTLTFVGSGPMEPRLRSQVVDLRCSEQIDASGSLSTGDQRCGNRIMFLPDVGAEERTRIFAEHDLLVLPSLTEISPNTALEAESAGLPVLLTAETGLSEALSRGVVKRVLRTPRQIADAVFAVRQSYETIAKASVHSFPSHPWALVASEHLALFHSLVTSHL